MDPPAVELDEHQDVERAEPGRLDDKEVAVPSIAPSGRRSEEGRGTVVRTDSLQTVSNTTVGLWPCQPAIVHEEGPPPTLRRCPRHHGNIVATHRSVGADPTSFRPALFMAARSSRWL